MTNYVEKWKADNKERRMTAYQDMLKAFRDMLELDFAKLAKVFGYELSKGGNEWMHGFKKPGVQVYVYHNAQSMDTFRFTVSTQLRHPKKGRTQLHRRHVSILELQDILRNPRVHTGRGYYKKTRSML